MNCSYINGEWLAGTQKCVNVNPSDTTDVIGEYDQAADGQVQQAIESAKEAQAIWQKSGLEDRYNVLMAIGQELISRSAELGRLLAREEGKPLAEGVGEVYRSGQFFTYYAAEVLRQRGDTLDSVRPGVEISVFREPVGVVAIISPWNFPAATACWKIAPALAFGNAVVWKPANQTPATAVAVAQIVAKHSLPAGLFNLVLGEGSGAGQQLTESPLVDAISFTGSVAVGRKIASAALGNLTKVQMEMGSKNPLVIMDDADLDLAVKLAVNGAFGGTGQKCTASSRIIVHRRVYEEFSQRLVAEAQALKVGHALAEGTQMGPVVSEQQLRENLAYVALAQQEGAELLCGGDTLELEHPGFYMKPTVFGRTHNQMRINREEMFAPITCLIEVDGYQQALAVANDTPFGLTSGIVTKSLARARHFSRHARTGCVMVNLPTAGTDYHVPFGGRGASSYGSREQGQYAVEFYTTVKTNYLASGSPEV